MRLWTKAFGKETKVIDFAGRTIVKGAYDDRNSDYGWNVDHIFPQSKGGVTADHNLVCCHILTNDEKADKFPCFTANNIKFKILKVQNHYEIREVDEIDKSNLETNHKVNYYDSSDGIRFFKILKGIQNKPRFVGSILIRLKKVKNTAVIDFIENFLDTENISYSMSNDFYNEEIRIIAKNYNMPLKEDTRNLLDKCILLNTYLAHYFEPMEYVQKFDIYYRIDYFKTKSKMYIDSQKINFEDIYGDFTDTLYISKLVIENTEANEKVKINNYEDWTEYNYIYTNLKNNLDKEVNGR